jgi:DNA recombination protein RmuC
MAAILPVVCAVVGLAVGALLVWLITRPQAQATAEAAAARAREAVQTDLAKAREELAGSTAAQAAQQERSRALEASIAALTSAKLELEAQLQQHHVQHGAVRAEAEKAAAQRDGALQTLEQARQELTAIREQAAQEMAALRSQSEQSLATLRRDHEAALHALRLAGTSAEAELRARIEQEQETRQAAERQLAELRSRDSEREKAFAEQRKLLDEAQTRFKDAFAALAQQQLERSSQSFLDLAKAQLAEQQQIGRGEIEKRQQAVEELVKPISETLGRFNSTVQEIEKQRAEAYGGISAELKGLREAQLALRSKADELTDALRGQPTKWGRWGELQLRNVVEMAGMLSYCDFMEQATVAGDDGARLRPDMVVRLPNGRSIAVDSKAPVELYLQAMELAQVDERQLRLTAYASAVRKHMKDLTGKAYWDRIPGSPEFVVMFVPGESFFSAALEADPALIEAGVEQRVILATPTTLIALLRAVAYGWKQEQLADNARHISEAGTELYKRLRVHIEHLQKVGSSLGSALGSYNEAVGSLERRVLPQARRMQELGAGDGKALPEIAALEATPRQVVAPELFAGEEA